MGWENERENWLGGVQKWGFSWGLADGLIRLVMGKMQAWG